MTDVPALVADHLDIWTAVTERRGAGRGGGKRVGFYGVERLRALILDLAVRGRLVPQDAGDEPAGELLAKTAKARLKKIAAERVRKPKPLAPLPSALPGLPQGWVWTQLGTLAEVSPGNIADDEVEASFVPMPLITTSVAGDHAHEVRRWGEIKKGFTHFADGDLGLAKITPCFENGKAAIFRDLHNGIGAGTTELHIARPWFDDLDRRYLLLTMKTASYLRNGEERMTGTAGQKRVTRAYFEATPLALPPLAEQRRIVVKVDELMALCDALERETADALAAHQTLVEALLATLVASPDADTLAAEWARLESYFDILFTTEASIDALKATVLDLAVRGKLVAQDVRGYFSVLSKDGNDKSLASPFVVPKGWRWVTVQEVADARLGKMLDVRKNKGTPKRYLRNANVRWFDFDLTDLLLMPFEDDELIELALAPGDVLICEGGEPGRTAVWDGRADDVYFQKAIHRVRFQGPVEPRFFSFCIKRSAEQGELVAYFTGSGIQHFTGRSLARFAFPLPPIAEQRRIVAKVNELTALCDALKARIADAAATTKHLADVVVERTAA